MGRRPGPGGQAAVTCHRRSAGVSQWLIRSTITKPFQAETEVIRVTCFELGKGRGDGGDTA